jgi:hypothetical protein
MSDLQPLLARSRYSDKEWHLASAGLCDWNTANYPRMEWCEKPSDPNSFYRWCTEHDQQVRDEDTYLAQWGHPAKYGR